MFTNCTYVQFELYLQLQTLIVNANLMNNKKSLDTTDAQVFGHSPYCYSIWFSLEIRV